MRNEDSLENLSKTQEYLRFRSQVPLRKICVDSSEEKAWFVYDFGPRNVDCPLICLPPAAGTADLFFKQILFLSESHIRILAMDFPCYNSVLEWCESFRRVLDSLKLKAPHILGASLGGFLAQKFAEHTRHCPRVSSLLLCQSYSDSADIKNNLPPSLQTVLPSGVMRKMLSNIRDHGCSGFNPVQCHNFAVEQVLKLSNSVLSSRLTLSGETTFVQPSNIQCSVSILDAFADCTERERAKNSLAKCFPDAKQSYFKQRTSLPYLAEHEQFNVFIMVHLMQFRNTKHDPFEISPI